MDRLDYHIPGYSFLHRRDPRVKIAAVMVVSLIILQVDGLRLLGLAALLLLTAWRARLSGAALLRNLQPVVPFFALLFVVYLFFTPGTPMAPFPIGPVQITYSGLHLGLLQIGKFTLLILAASLLLMTTSSSDFTLGLERLLRPLRFFRISSDDTALMLSLALRFLPLMRQEMESITQAQLARGARLNRSGVSVKIKALGRLAAPLGYNILRRSDELVEAMEARGYHPGPRSYLRELALNLADYCFLILLAVIAVASVFIPI